MGGNLPMSLMILQTQGFRNIESAVGMRGRRSREGDTGKNMAVGETPCPSVSRTSHDGGSFFLSWFADI